MRWNNALWIAATAVHLLPTFTAAQTCPLSWSPLGAGLTGGTGNVGAFAMVTFDEGTGPELIVSGNNTHAGGVPTLGVARWDGMRWTSVGDGESPASALAVYNDGTGAALYTRGSRWNGSAWQILPPIPYG